MAPAKTPPGPRSRKTAGMGIRMLHRRTPEAVTRVWADTASAQAPTASPVPALAAGASTARIPADPATTVRRAAEHVRRGLTDRARAVRTGHAPDWRQWADLARGYLALALTLIPRTRPRPTLTVFVASPAERPAPRHRDPRDPGPSAAL
ncbi:hypothetical protein SAMN04490357_2427 [Streptomyces misionensis]|uniref:Uncharacterized protein n=2 Tax=Streptomyces misionensis TaxID=67331 RepID=A0A1H4TYJ6_9ACTN|nr:hypothetical protein SAMN04490357_2427 [Streptomyces misionensis]